MLHWVVHEDLQVKTYTNAFATVAISATTLAATALADNAQISTNFARLGNWTFVPIVTQQIEGGYAVHRILALADKNSVPSDGITAIQYSRTAEEYVWTTKAWQSADQWKAIEWVKQDAGLVAVDDSAWPTSDVKDTNVAPAIEWPTDYAKGVLATDPLAWAVVSSPVRDELVSYLSAIGYKVADVPLERLSVEVCDGPLIDNGTNPSALKSPELTILASAAEEHAAMGQASTTQGFANSLISQAALRTRCCTIWYTIGPWGPYLPVGAPTWSLTAGNTPGAGGVFLCGYTKFQAYARTRVRVFVWPNCSTSTWTDTESGTLRAVETKDCDNPGGGTCPLTPGC